MSRCPDKCCLVDPTWNLSLNSELNPNTGWIGGVEREERGGGGGSCAPGDRAQGG